MTDNPKVIGSSAGLVPRNALVVIDGLIPGCQRLRRDGSTPLQWGLETRVSLYSEDPSGPNRTVDHLRDEFAQNTTHTLLHANAEHLHALIVLNAQLEDLFRRIDFSFWTE
jgi:hypothetical protein